MSEGSVAASMAQSIAESILGDQAQKLTDPIFASLGLSQGTDSAEYNQQVLNSLAIIEGDLDQISAALQTVSMGVTAIENTVTKISSQIQDVELQTKLGQYSQNANMIDQNYLAFSSAITAMSNTTTFNQGTDQLFSLFQINNANAVATAMKNIRDQLVGDVELKGIIFYQTDEVLPLYSQMAYAPSVDGRQIFRALPSVMNTAFETTIIPTLISALAVQLKGLHFLCSAWTGTINESNLETVLDGINDTIKAIHGFYATFDLDAMVTQALQTNCPRPTADLLNPGWFNLQRWDDGTADLQDGSQGGDPSPIDQNWFCWLNSNENLKPDTGINGKWTCFVKPPFFGFVSAAWCLARTPPSYYLRQIGVLAPSSENFSPPSTFISFLSSLPVTATAAFPINNGTLVKDAMGAKFFMIDNTLRSIINEETINNLFATSKSFVTITSAYAYPMSIPISIARIIAADQTVCLHIDGLKRGFVSDQALNDYGFDGSKMQFISAAEYEAIPTGAIMA
ncbi:MAG: hypothetical protein ABIQ40_02100 [Bacteroidia bacterium]